MAKKLESSKAIAKHIKQHTSNMQGADPNQCVMSHITILACHPRRKKVVKNQTPVKEPNGYSHPTSRNRSSQHTPLPYDRNPNQCTRCGDSPHAQGSNLTAQQRNTNAIIATKIGHFTKMCFTKNAHPQPQHYHKG